MSASINGSESSDVTAAGANCGEYLKLAKKGGGHDGEITYQGPVVRTPVSANPGLYFNPGFFIFLSKALSRIIFSIFLAYPNIKLKAKRIQLNWLFKLPYLSSKFALTLGYLNPASNNPVQSVHLKIVIYLEKLCN